MAFCDCTKNFFEDTWGLLNISFGCQGHIINESEFAQQNEL